MIILLDEPDLGYHPEWSRNLISVLISLLSQLFNDKNIQIILTSHSPFVAADLPRENIILLGTKNDKCIVSDRKINTFGENIHSLYKNGFFMTSTIGEFAKSKIEEVIIYINNGKYQENKDFCDYIISIVGEPLIKNKLLSMIDSQESIQDKINKRKKEIEELEKELKKNDKN